MNKFLDKNQLGFGAAGLVLGLLFFVVIAGVGYMVVTREGDVPSESSSSDVADVELEQAEEEPQSPGANVEESALTDNWNLYSNESVGLAFSYPPSLGDAELNLYAGIEGERFEITFENVDSDPSFIVYGATTNYRNTFGLFGTRGTEHAKESAELSSYEYDVSPISAQNIQGVTYSLTDGEIAQSGDGYVGGRFHVFDISGTFSSAVVSAFSRTENISDENAIIVEEMAGSLRQL